MNKDQMKGSAKIAAGRVQRATGKLLGSTKQKARGTLRQASGKLQKARGDLAQGVKAERKRRSSG